MEDVEMDEESVGWWWWPAVFVMLANDDGL